MAFDEVMTSLQCQGEIIGLKQSLDERCDKKGHDGEGNGGRDDDGVSAGITALRKVPATLYPAHEEPDEPASKNAYDDTTKDIARKMNTQIYTAIAL